MTWLLQRHGKATILHVEGVHGDVLLNCDWVAGELGMWVTVRSSGIGAQVDRKVGG